MTRRGSASQPLDPVAPPPPGRRPPAPPTGATGATRGRSNGARCASRGGPSRRRCPSPCAPTRSSTTWWSRLNLARLARRAPSSTAGRRWSGRSASVGLEPSASAGRARHQGGLRPVQTVAQDVDPDRRRPLDSASRIRSRTGNSGARASPGPARRRPTSVCPGRPEVAEAAVAAPPSHVEGPPGAGVDQQVDVGAPAWSATPAGKAWADPRPVPSAPAGSGPVPAAVAPVERWRRLGRRGRVRHRGSDGHGSTGVPAPARTEARDRAARPMEGGDSAAAGSSGPAEGVDRRRRRSPGTRRRCPSSGRLTPGRARSACRTRPWDGRRPRWCPATRAGAPGR